MGGGQIGVQGCAVKERAERVGV